MFWYIADTLGQKNIDFTICIIFLVGSSRILKFKTQNLYEVCIKIRSLFLLKKTPFCLIAAWSLHLHILSRLKFVEKVTRNCDEKVESFAVWLKKCDIFFLPNEILEVSVILYLCFI